MNKITVGPDEQELFLQDLDQKKRNRRVLKDVYASDSSEDEQEVNVIGTANDNCGANTHKGKDDDDDMFASDADDDEQQQKNSTTQSLNKSNSKIKGVKAMDMNQFEKNLDEDQNDVLSPDLINTTSIGDFMDSDKDENTKEDDNDIVSYYNNQEVSSLVHDDSVLGRKHRTKEPKMESFNLRQEKREGVFDEFGNYIRTKKSSDDDDDEDDEDEVKKDVSESGKDSWLSGVNDSDISKAKAAEELRKTEAHNKFLESKRKARLLSTEDILNKVILNLEAVETPIEMLKRFNIQVKKYTKLKDKDTVKSIKSQIKELTKLVEMLVDRRLTEVYNLTREELVREYKKITGRPYNYNSTTLSHQLTKDNNNNSIRNSNNTRKRKLSDVGDILETPDVHTANQLRNYSDRRSSGTAEVAGPIDNENSQIGNGSCGDQQPGQTADLTGGTSTMWEYKWSLDVEGDNEIYGPFDTETMIAWKESYFQENIAYSRRVGDVNGEYVDVRDIEFTS